ncbi:MAG: glycosyltransferase family 1 protein, partial [Chloroflexi bacterium]
RADAADLERQAKDQSVTLAIEVGLNEVALADRYRRAIATICAASMEPFGLTALESMACGTPVVAIDEAGYRESVRDGVTGLLVDPNAPALAAGIERIATDPQLVDALGRAGRESVVERWTWAHAGGRLEDLLLRTAAG